MLYKAGHQCTRWLQKAAARLTENEKTKIMKEMVDEIARAPFTPDQQKWMESIRAQDMAPAVEPRASTNSHADDTTWEC